MNIRSLAPSPSISRVILYVKDIEKVPAFKKAAVSRGLKFGPVHVVRNGPGHAFANAKDPAGNSISISSRGIKAGQPLHRS